MSKLEPADQIEATVGAKRHPTAHIARAVSSEQRVYVLHSAECVARGIDLRKCVFSTALDHGIDMGAWEQFQNVPVVVRVDEEFDDLVPSAVVDVEQRLSSGGAS